MKQLKMMLAAVASVALAAPAFAWDFSASGSAAAYFNSTSTTTITGATAVPSGGVSSAGGSLTLASSHTDGAKTASLTYVFDWDDNMDETITLSGSNKVGAWTASGEVAFSRGNPGCWASATATSHVSNPTNGSTAVGDNVTSAADNGTVVAASSSTSGACATTQTADDTSAITLTDGTMTIILGDASHLSGQNVSTSGAAAGALTMDAEDEDVGVGAFVGGFNGVSLGYKISDTMSVTGAYQKSSDVSDQMGAGEALDGETSASHGTTGFGIGFSGTFGPATVGITQASASTADVTGVAANALLSTKMSTLGLGIAIDLGDIDPFISWGTYTADGGNSKAQHKHSGSEIGLTYALGDDTVVVYVGNTEDIRSTNTSTAAGTDKALTKSAMEVGYNTTVGPASLSIGYGSATSADADKPTDSGTTYTYNDGYSKTDIEVALSFSF